MTKSPQDWQMNSSHTHSTTSSWPRCQSNGTIFDRPNQSPFLVNGCEGPVSTFNPRANHIPVASPIVTPSEIHTDPLTTRILVDPINSKSRVETQIPVRLTMYPMPQGIRRLHLPPHTVSKPKQLARPTPAKSPDMLELSCELVCSSPMEDERKRMVAFARAATETITSDSPTSSFDNGSYEKIREQKPSDGGRVMICSTCITREEKRASRKKSKNDDEDEAWQQYATNRVILFNSYEVKEWQRPSETRLSRTTADPRMNDRDYYNNIISDAPPGAMQIDLPMRIACYCRHQEEKKGFQ